LLSQLREAKRQRQKGNPAKSAAFRVGKKLKKQRKKGNPAKSAAFTAGKKLKRKTKRERRLIHVMDHFTCPVGDGGFMGGRDDI